MKHPLPLQRELVHITAALSLYGLATSLVGVFIPLIILTSGGPLSLVAGFYALYAVIKLVLNYPVIRTIQRFGTHVGLGLGFLAGALQLAVIFLYTHTHHPVALALGATALALTNAFIWSSQHLYISRAMSHATKSSSMATMEIVRQVITVVGPIIGGLIASAFGPAWILAAATFITASALIPLRHIGRLDQAADQAVPATRVSYDLKGAPARDIIANFCFNIDAATGNLLWPVYLAVAISTYRGIGLISALSAAAAIAAVYLAGHRGDRGHDRTVLRQGIAASSSIHLLRLLAATPLTIAALSAGYRATLSYFQNAWTSTYYAHAKQRGVHYIMSMEIGCDLASVFLWGLVWTLSLAASTTILFNVCFIIAALAAWGCLLITKQTPPNFTQHKKSV